MKNIINPAYGYWRNLADESIEEGRFNPGPGFKVGPLDIKRTLKNRWVTAQEMGISWKRFCCLWLRAMREEKNKREDSVITLERFLAHIRNKA